MANSNKKLCIDSRFSAPGSKGNADFRYVLTESIHIPDNMAMYVTDVCIPRSWYTIEYFNQYMFIRLKKKNNPILIYLDYKIALTQKNYSLLSLREEVQYQLNNEIDEADFEVNIDDARGTIKIRCMNPEYCFWVLSDKDLSNTGVAYRNSFNIDSTNPQSCNSVLGNTHTSDLRREDSEWNSGFIDLVGIHNIYITCSQFGNNSLGPQGERNILKKVVTTAEFGGLIVYNWANEYDHVDCSKMLLKTLDFKLTDAYGNPLILHGAHCSFTIVFVKR